MQGARVKHNEQLDAAHPIARKVSEQILARLAGHAQFFSAVLPLRTLPPLFNRYSAGGHYGFHVDGAVMNIAGSPQRLRSDVASTLFLCDPDDYDGGELVVQDNYGEHDGQAAGRRPGGVFGYQPA